jgi:tRNA-dihydrouridine synthase B
VSAAQVEPSAIHPIHLTRITLENNLALAPMAGVSNLPLRLIAREAGAALTFTETVSAKGLVMGGAKTRRLLRSSPREAPVAFQLFGSEPSVLADACRLLEGEEGAVWVDLNMGCPVRKFIRNGSGSALLRDPVQVAEVVRSMRQSFAGVLSVKMRSGWDQQSINAPEIARVAVSEGAELVSVHGRTRAQQYSGSADRTVIQRVTEAIPHTPVLANGDLERPDQVFEMLRDTGAAGAMIGRGALGNPWIFQQVLDLARGLPATGPTPAQRWAMVQRHITLMRGCFEDDASLGRNLKKYVTAYSKGLPGACDFRERVNRSQSLDEILGETHTFFSPAREAA